MIGPPPSSIKEWSWPWIEWLNLVYEKLHGPLWEDETATLSGAPSPGVAPADLAINGGPYKGKHYSVGDQLQVAFHTTHTIKPGSKYYVHVHWTTNGTATGTATWRVHLQTAKGYSQEAFPTATTVDIAGTAIAQAWTHYITEMSDAQAITAPEVDSLTLCTLELEASSDFGADKVVALYCDIHYQWDRFGTPKRNGPNFYTR